MGPVDPYLVGKNSISTEQPFPKIVIFGERIENGNQAGTVQFTKFEGAESEFDSHKR